MVEPALSVRDLRVSFGGIKAVQGLSLEARVGDITGLIGPNGAGKTTTFNACSGLLRPDGGSVELFGRDVTRFGSAARARMGMGRTFQRIQVFESMTVRENVRLGREARYADRRPWQHVVRRRSEVQAVESAAADALDLCGLSDLADRPTGTLSTGQKRQVELARVVAGGFGLLLLDEPSSGLDRLETDWFAGILLELVRERDLAILLVEHDMAMTLSICSRIVVLDFGRHLTTGTPEDIRRSPEVRRAYLGDDEPVSAEEVRS